MKIRKVTFQFDNGAEKSFNVQGIVGAFIATTEVGGGLHETVGGFSMGDYTPTSVRRVTEAVINAAAVEMINQGIEEQDIVDTLKEIVAGLPITIPVCRERLEDEKQLVEEDKQMQEAISLLDSLEM